MISALAIGVGLLLCACAHYVRMGCRAIGELCAELERDRQVEYRFPIAGVPRRQCPQWMSNLSPRAVRVAGEAQRGPFGPRWGRARA